MTTLSMAHDQWHRMHGRYTTCDLDCGAGEAVADAFEADAAALEAGAHSIRCGACGLRHTSVATVKFCYEVKRDAETWKRTEEAAVAAITAAGECEHGLSAAFCDGPGHYPADL